MHYASPPDLRQVDALSVAERDDLVEGEEQVERVVQDLRLVHRAAVLGDLKGQGNANAEMVQCSSKHSK